MAKSIVYFLAMLVVSTGCGPDRAILDSKLDSPLKQMLSSVPEGAPSRMLVLVGKCSAIIDGAMRQDLVDAGAEVSTMNGDTFTAKVSSENVLNVAGLEFVVQLGLPRESDLKQ